MEPPYSDVKTLAALPQAQTLGPGVRWAYGELEKFGLPIDFEVAKRFPLITYSAKNMNDVITAAAAVAVGWGVPKEIVWAYAIDLDSEKELEWLRSQTWETLWNGVWIILGSDSTRDDDFFSRDGEVVLYLGSQNGQSAWEDAERVTSLGTPIISHGQLRYGIIAANDWCGGYQKAVAAKANEVAGKSCPFIGSAERIFIDTKSSIGSIVAGEKHLTPGAAEKLARDQTTDGPWCIVA